METSYYKKSRVTERMRSSIDKRNTNKKIRRKEKVLISQHRFEALPVKHNNIGWPSAYDF